MTSHAPPPSAETPSTPLTILGSADTATCEGDTCAIPDITPPERSDGPPEG